MMESNSLWSEGVRDVACERAAGWSVDENRAQHCLTQCFASERLSDKRSTPMSTVYHARYFAYELTRKRPAADADRLSMSLFDACVDLNPHQIDAAMFALKSPLS